MEIILGFAILNKAGGAYGILSIITGHPLNFWQWLYNILAIAALPFYITALSNLTTRNKNVDKISSACLIYIIDTILGLFFTIYFMIFWFISEDPEQLSTRSLSHPNVLRSTSSTSSEDARLASQSASSGRELFYISAFTIVVTTARIYFTLILLSFTRVLLKQESISLRYDTNEGDFRLDSTSSSSILEKTKKFIQSIDTHSKRILRLLFG